MTVKNRFKQFLGHTYREVDRKRIQLHLKRAEKELRQKNTDQSRQLEQRRQENLDSLNEYWKAGNFPQRDKNDTAEGRKPVFKDSNNTPCAMAYLMEQDGKQELVEQVAETDNDIWIEDIDEGPVKNWIEESGLTPDEAARIQPTYSQAVVSTCGPITCTTLKILMLVLGASMFGLLERTGYRFASKLFPENVLKRRASFGYFSVMNLLLVPAVAVFVYSLFP